MKDIADLLARILLAFLFIYEAIDGLVFFEKSKATMTAYGITWRQDLLLWMMITLLLVGGFLVLIGYYANVGAFMLLMYWLPFTLVVYSFWNDPAEFKRIHAPVGIPIKSKTAAEIALSILAQMILVKNQYL